MRSSAHQLVQRGPSTNTRLVVTAGIYPPDVGGPATYVERLVRTLARDGRAASVVVTTDGPSARETVDEHVDVWRVARRQFLLLRMVRFCLLVRRLAKSAAVVYANGSYFESVLGARLARRPVVIKVVGDRAWEVAFNAGVTTADLVEFQGMRAPTLAVAVTRRLQRWWCRHATRVIVSTEFLADVVEGWGVPRERLVVIPNAAEVPSGPGPRSAPAGSGVRVLTGGRLLGWKGIDIVVRAVARVPDAQLTIVGSGPEQDALERLVHELGVEARVRIVPAVAPTEIAQLYDAHDVFALASSSETFSYMTIEAMAHGLPVVVANSGALPEVAGDGAWGDVVKRDDVDAWARALERLATDAGHYAARSRAGLAAVEGRYDWSQIFPATEAVLDTAAHGPATRPALCYVVARYSKAEHTVHLDRLFEELYKHVDLHVVLWSHDDLPADAPWEVHVLDTRTTSRVRRLVALVRLARRLRKQGCRTFFVRIAHHAAFVLALLQRPLDIDVFLWHSGITTESHPPRRWGTLREWARWRVGVLSLRFAIHRVRALVTGPQAMADYYAREFGAPRVVVLANDVDVPALEARAAQTNVAAVRADLGLRDGASIVFYAGTISRWKLGEGGRTMLDVIDPLVRARPDVHFVAAGPRGLPEVDAWADDPAVRDRVHLLGPLPFDRVMDFYAAADVFVLPVIGAGFPRVLLESMAAGTPMVAYDTAGVRDVVPPEAPAVPAGDPAEFRRRIEVLLDDPAEYERQCQAGKARVQLFSTEKVAADLIAATVGRGDQDAR